MSPKPLDTKRPRQCCNPIDRSQSETLSCRLVAVVGASITSLAGDGRLVSGAASPSSSLQQQQQQHHHRHHLNSYSNKSTDTEPAMEIFVETYAELATFCMTLYGI